MAKGKGQTDAQIRKESAEQIRLDPLAAAERRRNQLSLELDSKLQQYNRAVGDEAIASAGSRLLLVDRYYIGFGHALAMASGKRIYEVRSSVYDRAGSEFLRRRLKVLRGTSGPSVELSKEDRALIEAVEKITQPQPAPVVELKEYPQVEEKIRPSMD